MRRTDLSVPRQRSLVRAEGYPHCWALLPPATPRDLPSSRKLSTALAQAAEALGRLAIGAAHLPNLDLITRTLARREAVASSQIEGTHTGLPELLEYEATGGPEKMPADARITERYVTALEVGLAALRDGASRKALTNDVVRGMHRILLQDASERYLPGDYRTQQAWIGGYRIEDATFVPPPPAYIQGCMAELESSMLQYERGEEEFFEISIAAQLALAHAQFETIHPFVDGNGRVGRLIMPLMLAAAGYPPLYLSGFLLKHRSAYYDALAGVQLREGWERWGIFLSQAIVHASETSLAISADLNAIHDRWEAQLGDLRADAAARNMPRLLLGRPIVSVAQVAGLLGISFVTANKAIDLLIERGILTDSGTRRNRIFMAGELVARLEQP